MAKRAIPNFLLWLALVLAGCAHYPSPAETCSTSAQLQAEKSAELQRLEKEDQADRAKPYDQIDWNKVGPRDEARRVRVADLFAKGCFHSVADYASAALIYQHGTVPDHFYQTFVWANEAVRRGDSKLKQLAALGIDRYLVAMHHKQLFGSQMSRETDGPWCLQPVEKTVPAAFRAESIPVSQADAIAFTLKATGSDQDPKSVKECSGDFAPSPRGTVPGFW